VFFRSRERTFYVYGFAKSARDNISDKELRKLKDNAKDGFALTDEQIKAMLKMKTLSEII
jgi:hypothetical protein